MFTHAYDENVGKLIDVRAFELCFAAVHHKFCVTTGKHDKAEAPGRVSQNTATQQQLVVIERERLVAPRHCAFKLAQHVVWRLAFYFS